MPRVVEVRPENFPFDSNLFQSAFWARFKKRRGYQTQTFWIDYQGRTSPLVLVHRPCAENAGFGYIPHGPDIDLPPEQHGPFLEKVSERIRSSLPDGCRFLRYDLPWPSPYGQGEEGGAEACRPPEPRIRELRMNFGCRRWNLHKAPTDMQAPDTVLLDLNQPASRILSDMHKKARYCVRSAFRRGVRIEREGPELLPDWHRLYAQMAERKGIAFESLEYFDALFAAARGRQPRIRLYAAFRNSELLAGSIFAFHAPSSQATYLFSASSAEGRKQTAAYAILWKAMMDAKVDGCRWFDFFGIPPADRPEHPMHGLYRFKTRFGGDIRRMRGCWDYPFDEQMYSMLALSSSTKDAYHLSQKR
ncbi:MAG: peptidoglycan bridge formation glycyltransferase FemA/FemB family protein [Desulfobacterales bacterium]|nr:peptidoglycan bridge formation glycyltransferase FemA/FemB family protein [Desulfobacterales bacterium]